MTNKVSAIDRPLRADAARNREKILLAAAKVFAERGLDATLDEIAAAADVGVGTVYRRFPDKDSLVAALFEQKIEDLATLAERARHDANSWDGFVWFLEQVLARQCENKGLRDVLAGSPYAHDAMEAAADRIVPIVMALIERAQRDGYLRPDLLESDVTVLEKMISSLASTSGGAPDLWRRYLAIILDGLVVRRDQPCSLPTPGDELASSPRR